MMRTLRTILHLAASLYGWYLIGWKHDLAGIGFIAWARADMAMERLDDL